MLMRVFLAVLVMCALTTPVFPAERRVTIGYLEQLYPQPPILYNLDDRPSDEGLFGARLALADNRTTGKFLNTGYDLTEEIVPDGGDLVSAARSMLEKTPFLVVVASQADLLRIADLPEAQNALLFNAGSADIALRDDACRHNVLHTLPSRDMLTDALAQFAQARKWTELALISGERADDQAYADAMTKSATKFGLTIVGRKQWA
ncbi:MAG: hypothetical protein RIR97_2026, partial [Pseudomonadota bacterium]